MSDDAAELDALHAQDVKDSVQIIEACFDLNGCFVEQNRQH